MAENMLVERVTVTAEEQDEQMLLDIHRLLSLFQYRMRVNRYCGVDTDADLVGMTDKILGELNEFAPHLAQVQKGEEGTVYEVEVKQTVAVRAPTGQIALVERLAVQEAQSRRWEITVFPRPVSTEPTKVEPLGEEVLRITTNLMERLRNRMNPNTSPEDLDKEDSGK